MYLVAQAGIKAGCNVSVADLTHEVHGFIKFGRGDDARILLTGNEMYRHVCGRDRPSFPGICLLHETEQVEEAVGSKAEGAQRVGIVRLHDILVGAYP